LKGESVSVVKINEKELTGEYVGIFTDSLTVGMETIAIENVKEVQIKNHSKGAFTGMGLGFISGFFIGSIIGRVSSDSDYGPGIGVILGLPPGVLLGGLIGGVSGVTDKFVFPSPEMGSEPAKPSNRVEFTKIIENGRGYIVILCQEKEIKLLRAEYNYLVEADDGKQFIIIPEDVYLEKFK
jgi:hypothetical protein